MSFEKKARLEINEYMNTSGIVIPDQIIDYYLAARQCDEREIKLAFIKSIEALGDPAVDADNPAHVSLIKASYLAKQVSDTEINIVDFMAGFKGDQDWAGFYAQLRNETGSEENQVRATAAAGLIKSAVDASPDMSRANYEAVARVARKYPVEPFSN